MLPSRPVVVGAVSSELSTASSAASTTASNRSSSARPETTAPSSQDEPSRSARRVVETPRKISPLPWCAVEPVRASPSPIRRASRAQSALIDRCVGDHDADARAGRPLGVRRPRAAAARRDAVDGQPLALAEVGEQQDRHGVPVGRDPRRRADAALEAQAGHPGAGADRALRRAASPRRARPARRACAAATSSCSTCIRRQSLRNESSHSPTTGITTVVGHPGVLLERDPAGRVVDAAQLHGRGEVDRRLERRPTRPRSRKPVHSPAPLSTAPPAASGRG